MQVVPRPGEAHTLLFELDENGRRELIESPRSIAPERTSTSALTRPLLQDFVLRPDVFVGGPSEVAYYAQIAPLHEMLNIAMPRVALRAHELLAPKRLARTVERYDIKAEEIFAGTDAALATREPAGVAEVHAIAEKARLALAADITRIGEIALPAEHALARAINRSIGHIEYHFGKLTERAIRGLARKDRERYAAVRELGWTKPYHVDADHIEGAVRLLQDGGDARKQGLVPGVALGVAYAELGDLALVRRGVRPEQQVAPIRIRRPRSFSMSSGIGFTAEPSAATTPTSRSVSSASAK